MKYWNSRILHLLTVLFLVAGCAATPQNENAQAIIQQIKTLYVPDTRVNRFEVSAETRADSLVLTGETTLPEAKAALLDSLSARAIPVADHITVLPAANLKGKTYGLVNNSVANIRSEPDHTAQLATQALLGMPVQVLKQHSGWYLVKTPDDYISWVNESNIRRMDKTRYDKWRNASKVIYKNTYGFSYRQPSESASRVTDLVTGDILKLKGESGDFYKVAYPDGRMAYVQKVEAKLFKEWNKNLQVTKASLIREAKTMLGVPYLWGGTSAKGVDCSGFTKTIYFMNGRILPRDASQQVHAGKQIDTQKQWQKLQAGDLLFFGHPATDSTEVRVVHVGMWIGNDEFIHSSGNVHISSMDSSAPDFDAYNLGRYLQTRRYLNNWQGNITKTADMYHFIDDAR